MIKKTFHRLIIKNQQNQGKNLLIQDLTVIKRKNKESLKKMQLKIPRSSKEVKVKEQSMAKRRIRLMQ